MTSIQEQLKALKAQESALKAQLKKSQKKSKEELKNIADFKKYVAQYDARPDFSRIIKYVNDIDIGSDGGLETFENWFIAWDVKSKDKKIKKINKIYDLIDGAYPDRYTYKRKLLLDELDELDEEYDVEEN
jgi:hypothetical protein